MWPFFIQPNQAINHLEQPKPNQSYKPYQAPNQALSFYFSWSTPTNKLATDFDDHKPTSG